MGRRWFVASAAGVVVEVPAEVDQALDVLAAAGVLHAKSAELVWAAHRDGRDVVAFAHHFVCLASAVAG